MTKRSDGSGTHSNPTQPNSDTARLEMPKQFGHYKAEHILGRGGMGEVWLALDTRLDRRVALKVMRRELLTNDEAVKRFYREARAVARLNHPNIVQVYAIDEEKGMIYFVMEYVEGDTVSSRVKASKGLGLEESVRILLQTVEGLGYAYTQGIIHRDIKPSNLMITPDNRVKIADFGLAKIVEADTQVTQAGTTMGSPSYMSPEQARGGEVDHRSDMYSLGITWYQMLLNQLPFTADQPLSILLKHINEPLPEPPELARIGDGRVLDVLRVMTAKNPADRYQTYAGLASALVELAPNARLRASAFVSTEAVKTTAPPAGERKDGTQEGQGPATPSTGGGTPATEAFSARRPRGAAEGEEPKGIPAMMLMMVAAAVLVLAGVVTAVVMSGGRRGETPSAEIAQPTPAPAVPTPTPVPQEPIVEVVPTPTAAPQETVLPVPTRDPLLIASAPPTDPQVGAPPGTGVVPPATPAPTPAPPPQPTPPVSAEPDIIIGGPGVAQGSPVKVMDAELGIAYTIPAGTRAEFVRSEEQVYRIQYQGRVAVVPHADTQRIVGGMLMPGGSGPPSGAARTGLLGKGVENEPDVDIFSDNSLRRRVKSLPSGTEVTIASEERTGYIVTTSDGKQGFVLKNFLRVQD